MCCAYRANLFQASSDLESTVGTTTVPALTRRLQRKRFWSSSMNSAPRNFALQATLAASSYPTYRLLPTVQHQRRIPALSLLSLRHSHCPSLLPTPHRSPSAHPSLRLSAATRRVSALSPPPSNHRTRSTHQSFRICAPRHCLVCVTPATRLIPSGTRPSVTVLLLLKTCKLSRLGGRRRKSTS
jgi:hypothetical protein